MTGGPDSALRPPLAPFVTLNVAAVATGYSVKAMRRKMERGIWLEGHEYVRAPDGRILFSVDGYERWAKGLRVLGRR